MQHYSLHTYEGKTHFGIVYNEVITPFCHAQLGFVKSQDIIWSTKHKVGLWKNKRYQNMQTSLSKISIFSIGVEITTIHPYNKYYCKDMFTCIKQRFKSPNIIHHILKLYARHNLLALGTLFPFLNLWNSPVGMDPPKDTKHPFYNNAPSEHFFLWH